MSLTTLHNTPIGECIMREEAFTDTQKPFKKRMIMRQCHTPDVFVRKATDSDFTDLSTMEQEPPIVGDVFCDDLFRLMLPSTYVAIKNDDIVGFVIADTIKKSVLKRVMRGFKYPPQVPRKGVKLKDVLVVFSIRVRNAHQNQGIGKQLVRHVLSKPHKFVDYETPFKGKHVIQSCCSDKGYATVLTHQDREYAHGTVAHHFCFECV